MEQLRDINKILIGTKCNFVGFKEMEFSMSAIIWKALYTIILPISSEYEPITVSIGRIVDEFNNDHILSCCHDHCLKSYL